MSYRELLLGCGNRRERYLDPYLYQSNFQQRAADIQGLERWRDVTTVDHDRHCHPHYIMDLSSFDWCCFEDEGTLINHAVLEAGTQRGSFRFRDNVFEEVHAYEVLEHLGQQGNEMEFFQTFNQIWRVLTPGGFLCATVPSRFSPWLWGDPGHRRAILPVSLVFLHRPHYSQAVGTSPSSDYRNLLSGDFDIVHSFDNQETHSFILQAVKPARRP